MSTLISALDNDIKIVSDSKKLFLGAGSDATIHYDGTNLVLSPAIDGSGVVKVMSTDESNYVSIGHDNTDAYFKTDDGAFVFLTDEGTNTNTFMELNGKGTGYAVLRIYDQDDAEYLQLDAASGNGEVYTAGSSPVGLSLQPNAACDVDVFGSAANNKTPELTISGFRDGGTKDTLQIGVGVDVDQHASYDGVPGHLFSNKMTVGSLVAGSGTLHVDQTSASGAMPVLVLDQADVDEDYIKIIGTSDTNVDRALVDAADFTTPGAITGWIKINVQDDQATNPIADGDYYIPFYAAPSA